MSIRPRALWLGLAAASLAAVLVAAGLLVWQRQEFRRYATVAELNYALNAAGRQATAMRNAQTTSFGWSAGPFETTREELARRDAPPLPMVASQADNVRTIRRPRTRSSAGKPLRAGWPAGASPPPSRPGGVPRSTRGRRPAR